MDLDSDEGEDGGVRIDDYLEVSVTEPNNNDANIKARYYQDVSHINAEPGEILWQLPVPPIRVKKNACALHYALELAYHKHCDLIFRRWNCDSSEMLPASLALTTPYSFTMLSALRGLATHSRESRGFGRDLVHTMLLEQVANRLFEQQTPTDIVTTSAREIMPHSSKRVFGEDQIIERVDGLMIEDVIAVRKSAQMTQRQSKKARRAHGASEVAESKQVARERLRASRLGSRYDMDINAASMRGSQAAKQITPYAVWRAEIAQGYGLAQAVQQRPAHSGVVTEVQDAMADADPTLVHRDRQDQKLTRLARRVFAAENEERRDKKMAHRSATSLARSKQATSTLPSERLNFTTLPTLASVTESQKPSAKHAGVIQQQSLPGSASLVVPIHGLRIE